MELGLPLGLWRWARWLKSEMDLARSGLSRTVAWLLVGLDRFGFRMDRGPETAVVDLWCLESGVPVILGDRRFLGSVIGDVWFEAVGERGCFESWRLLVSRLGGRGRCWSVAWQGSWSRLSWVFQRVRGHRVAVPTTAAVRWS